MAKSTEEHLNDIFKLNPELIKDRNKLFCTLYIIIAYYSDSSILLQSTLSFIDQFGARILVNKFVKSINLMVNKTQC